MLMFLYLLSESEKPLNILCIKLYIRLKLCVLLELYCLAVYNIKTYKLLF